MMDAKNSESPQTRDVATQQDDSVRLRAIEIIETVMGLLDEAFMARQFDEPIARAAGAFECAEPVRYSYAVFLQTVADCVRHLYEHGLAGHRRLSDSQARDEAVALLEQAYQGSDADGYEAATVDAADPSQAGIQAVVATLAEALKERERRAYVRWVMALHIDAADWNTRCAMAAVLLERLAECLPPDVRGCSPEQLADHVSRLLLADVATSRQLQQHRL